MMKLPFTSLTPIKNLTSSKRNTLIAIIAALVVVAVGWFVLQSRAALPVPGAPANVRAFTGGKDIAILWNASESSVAIQRYNVYRDYRLIAQIKPTNDSSYLTAKGTRYYDANVQAGKSYKYRISATNTNGTTSGWSNTITVTHPAKSAAVPTITIDAAGTTDLTSTLNQAKATLTTWYPKIANTLAWPDYTPPTSFTIKVDPSYTLGAAYAKGQTIGVNPDYFRKNPKDMGAFVHEGAHMVQQFTAYSPRLIVEGTADWVREYMFSDRNPSGKPGVNTSYNDGYGTSAYFLRWISSTYNKPNLVRQLNITGHAGGSYASVLSSSTGKTVGQLWTQLMGRQTSNLGPITGVANRCLDLLNYSVTNGNTIQLVNCVKNGAQDWIRIAEPSSPKAGAFTLHVLGKCMDVQYSGKAAGTPVWSWACNGGLAQQWVPQSNGTLLNPNSGMCLQTKGGASTNGVALEIAVCNASSAAQKWKLPPL